MYYFPTDFSVGFLFYNFLFLCYTLLKKFDFYNYNGGIIMDLNFRMVHQNFNVADLDTSLDFYEKALGLTEKSRIRNLIIMIIIW